MFKRVWIRRLSEKGSTATEYAVIAEAEKVLAAARKRGALLVDEATDENVTSLPAGAVEHVLVVDPIQGGAVVDPIWGG